MSRTILILQRGSVFSLNLFNLVFMHIFYCLSDANPVISMRLAINQKYFLF